MGSVEIQFVADMLAVVVHGSDADFQPFSNFLAGQIFAYQFENPTFGRRQRFDLGFAQQEFFHPVTSALASLKH
jgi:hypothetical protein